MERQTSPILSPPATEFPYPEPKRAKQEARVDSDWTLYERQDGSSKPSQQRSTKSTEQRRPGLAASKHQTEISRPIGRRHALPIMHKKSTNGRQLAQPTTAADPRDWSDDSSSSFSSSSSSEDEPIHSGARELNQVKRRPRRVSRKDTHGRFSGGNDRQGVSGRWTTAHLCEGDSKQWISC